MGALRLFYVGADRVEPYAKRGGGSRLACRRIRGTYRSGALHIQLSIA